MKDLTWQEWCELEANRAAQRYYDGLMERLRLFADYQAQRAAKAAKESFIGDDKP